MTDERKWSLPFEPCEHIEALTKALTPLNIILNDGYSDWFHCMEHEKGVRLTDDGFHGARFDNQYWYRLRGEEWEKG